MTFDSSIYFHDSPPLNDKEAAIARDLASQLKKHYTYDDLPAAAISASSYAAGERMGMGALHIGSHVLLRLLNQGIVILNPENDNTPWTETTP